MGFAVGVLAMGLALLTRRWMLAAVAGLLGSMALLILAPISLIDLLSDAPPVEAIGGMGGLGFRQEVWTQAINGIHDFVFTGMGLGTFREIVRILYPLSIDPGYDIGHAHNFFLQSGLDFGLPGLIAVIATILSCWRVFCRYYKLTYASGVWACLDAWLHI